MGKKVTMEFGSVDFESAVDEVDVIVPNYLDALESLSGVENLEQIPTALNNVVSYWKRLANLFKQIEPFEEEIPFRQIMQDTLQTELGILEQIYLRINLKVEFGAQNWTTALVKSSHCVLKRMEVVLRDLGFPESHQDRVLIAELLANGKKKRKMA